MASPPTTRDQSASSTHDVESNEEPDRAALERWLPSLAGPIRVLGFWSAIALPFLYVPLLVVGLSSGAETAAFLSLLGLNLLSLYVGRFHRR